MIDHEIEEYRLAMKESLEAQQGYMISAVRKRAAHYRLLKAKDAIRMREREVLEDSEREVH